MAEARTTFDVIVAGGGLVGAAAALGLARAGHEVALIDQVAPSIHKGALGFDARTVALNPASMNLLESIDVADALPRTPFRHVFVWEERGTRHIEFDAQAVGREALGHIVEVSAGVMTLWAAMADEPRITPIIGAAVDGIEPTADGVTVRLGDRAVLGRLVLAADGGESKIRGLLNGGDARFETGHAAIATVVEVEREHQDTAWQIFRADGPVALLPLTGRDERHFVSVVWSQVEARAAEHMRLSDEGFTRALERAVERKLGAILAVDKRHSFPLMQRVAERFQPAPRVLLIGDAARVLHPLAGQGVNLGFEDVAGVLDVVREVGIDGVGAGGADDAEVWRAFVRRRRTRAQIMVRAMDAFRVAYSISDPGIAWLRNVAVDVLNGAPFIKTELMREALGLR